MIRVFLPIIVLPVMLSSCFIGRSETTMIKTDEKALLNNSSTGSQKNSPPEMKTIETASPGIQTIDTEDMNPYSTEISPVSNVVSPIGSQ